MSMEGQDTALLDDPNADPNAEADFLAAFNHARGDADAEGSTTSAATSQDAPTEDEPQPGDAPADDAEAAAKAAAEAEAKAAAEREAEANAPATLTRADLDALKAQLARVPELEQQLQQANQQASKAFGKIGSLQQTIDAIKTQVANGKPPSIKQLKRFQEEFPELGDLLLADLTEAFGGTDGGDAAPNTPAEPDPAASATAQAEPVDPLNAPEVVAKLRQKEMAIVDAVHPDWRQLKATPEFAEWQRTLPQAAQHLLANTWDSGVMNDAFKDFKAYQAQRAQAAEQQRTAAQAASKQRDKRLEHGAPATTGAATGVNAIDDDEAFAAGFKAVRG